jgi:hypothetical protein
MGRPARPAADHHGDTFDWQQAGPLEFLDHLRSVRSYVVDGVHRGWVRSSDLPQLISLLDSQDPCGSVAMRISSYHESQLSTVGQEAAFLIDGFRSGRYPPRLNSTRPATDVDQVREWWNTFSNRPMKPK